MRIAGSGPAAIVTVLHHSLQLGSLLLFPALALRALHTGGPRRLRLAAVLALAAVSLFALAAAAAQFGNRLAPVRGYGYTAPRTLLLYGLTLGLPVLSAAGLVRTLDTRGGSTSWVYAAAVLGAGLTWVAGVFLATWLLPRLA